MNEFDQSAWIAQAKKLLDDSARDLDATAASRLNRGRQFALAQGPQRTPRPWLLPTGLASACALLLAVAIWHPHYAGQDHSSATTVNGPGSGATVEASTADGDASPAEDSVEFYQDLEFYAWLDAQGKDGDG